MNILYIFLGGGYHIGLVEVVFLNIKKNQEIGFRVVGHLTVLNQRVSTYNAQFNVKKCLGTIECEMCDAQIRSIIKGHGKKSNKLIRIAQYLLVMVC